MPPDERTHRLSLAVFLNEKVQNKYFMSMPEIFLIAQDFVNSCNSEFELFRRTGFLRKHR